MEGGLSFVLVIEMTALSLPPPQSFTRLESGDQPSHKVVINQVGTKFMALSIIAADKDSLE